MIRKWSQEEKEELCMEAFGRRFFKEKILPSLMEAFGRRFFKEKILPSLIESYIIPVINREFNKEEIMERVKSRCEKEFLNQDFVNHEINMCAASLNDKEMIFLRLIVQNAFLHKLEKIFTDETFHNSIIKFILNLCSEEREKILKEETINQEKGKLQN